MHTAHKSALPSSSICGVTKPTVVACATETRFCTIQRIGTGWKDYFTSAADDAGVSNLTHITPSTFLAISSIAFLARECLQKHKTQIEEQ